MISATASGDLDSLLGEAVAAGDIDEVQCMIGRRVTHALRQAFRLPVITPQTEMKALIVAHSQIHDVDIHSRFCSSTTGCEI